MTRTTERNRGNQTSANWRRRIWHELVCGRHVERDRVEPPTVSTGQEVVNNTRCSSKRHKGVKKNKLRISSVCRNIRRKMSSKERETSSVGLKGRGVRGVRTMCVAILGLRVSLCRAPTPLVVTSDGLAHECGQPTKARPGRRRGPTGCTARQLRNNGR